MPSPPRALIFDCDGTLADTMPAHFAAWCEALAPHGLRLSETRFYEWAGVPTRDIVARLADEAGLVVDAAAVSLQRDALFHARGGVIESVAPVLSVAAAFRGEGPMAVASGSTRDTVARTLAALGVRDWFDAVVCAEDVRRPKPAPDVFVEAARRLGVPPRACRAFEDSDLGLEAIRAAGMEAVDVRPMVHEWRVREWRVREWRVREWRAGRASAPAGSVAEDDGRTLPRRVGVAPPQKQDEF